MAGVRPVNHHPNGMIFSIITITGKNVHIEIHVTCPTCATKNTNTHGDETNTVGKTHAIYGLDLPNGLMSGLDINGNLGPTCIFPQILFTLFI